jgi:hypothetical protein
MALPGNRNMDIIAPVIGFTDLRSDLDQFKVPIVLSQNPRYRSSHAALEKEGEAWFGRGMDVVDAAQHAQFLSGKHLTDFLLQRLVVHVEEDYKRFQTQSGELEVRHEE